MNVISAYAPQTGLDEEVKRSFWEGLDEVVRGISHTEIFIGRDFNGHIGTTVGGNGEVHGGFNFSDRNRGGTSVLDFAKAFELVANYNLSKREDHLVNFQSMVANTYIDYLLLMRCDKELCKDCKTILSETLATQHMLLLMDICTIIKRKKRVLWGRVRIRWGPLTKDKDQELEGRLMPMGAWMRNGDASSMWTLMVICIREDVREVLGITKGNSGRHRGEWWWNDKVQGKVEAKKAAYLKSVERTNEEEMRANRERYKEARKEAKLAITHAKIAVLVVCMRKLGKKTRKNVISASQGKREEGP
ncbi:uncharacterized protein LOC142181919 [Nicotiana tabacum]|uniref:Uncharacterized protein LOC142181919 n=1 Tax=Nicotiana tabacum TaxID=4097 RepID=A0AC58UQE1_TOBAC